MHSSVFQSIHAKRKSFRVFTVTLLTAYLHSAAVVSANSLPSNPQAMETRCPYLWKQAVEERVPAVDWLLKKYEENKIDIQKEKGAKLKTGNKKRKKCC